MSRRIDYAPGQGPVRGVVIAIALVSPFWLAGLVAFGLWLASQA